MLIIFCSMANAAKPVKIIRSDMIKADFNFGMFLIPLTAHFVFTAIVCLLASRLSTRYYPLAVFAGAIVHALYNLAVLGVIP